MLKLWLPAGLYRVLPLVYLLAGSMMLLVFGGDAMGRTSGLFLIAAGCLIWVLRLVARTGTSSRPR
jgi:hypothetical protein